MNKRYLRACIAEKGLTISTVAERAGISKTALQRLLHNDAKPRLSTIGKLAKALNVDVRELLEE